MLFQDIEDPDREEQITKCNCQTAELELSFVALLVEEVLVPKCVFYLHLHRYWFSDPCLLCLKQSESTLAHWQPSLASANFSYSFAKRLKPGNRIFQDGNVLKEYLIWLIKVINNWYVHLT